jgi:hypothetical protein
MKERGRRVEGEGQGGERERREEEKERTGNQEVSGVEYQTRGGNSVRFCNIQKKKLSIYWFLRDVLCFTSVFLEKV